MQADPSLGRRQGLTWVDYEQGQATFMQPFYEAKQSRWRQNGVAMAAVPKRTSSSNKDTLKKRNVLTIEKGDEQSKDNSLKR
jgi:hypothetical protein